MRQTILNDLTIAMKAQDKEVLSVLRMVKGAMQMEEINLKRELIEEEVLAIIQKQVKTRKESIVEFEKGNRQDLIEQTKQEMSILNRYLPAQLTEEEIKQIIHATLSGQSISVSDMGKWMGILTKQLKGRADLGTVSQLLKEELSK